MHKAVCSGCGPLDHVGSWFDSPGDAVAAGCASAVTPFNGDHPTGIQVLNTRTFRDTAGPLSQLG